MAIELSVILPTIRLEKIDAMLSSFEKSYTKEYELIIVSPYQIPEDILNRPRVKYIHSLASPVVCQQMALIEATGDYIHRAVDDATYIEGAMSIAMKKAKKDVLSLKFLEGEDKSHRDMVSDDFYLLKSHLQTLCLYVPQHFKLLNFGIVSRILMQSLGGWDCQFETIAIAELDLAIRLQFNGIKVVLSDNLILKCTWTPGTEGDHAPMHYAFDDDMKKYKQIYDKPSCEDRFVLINNWKDAPVKWGRRFK